MLYIKIDITTKDTLNKGRLLYNMEEASSWTITHSGII